jgi:galactokinase
MTWLAWYAPGTFTAVMDYMDYIDGELVPAAM